MLFNSFEFLWLFLITFSIYYIPALRSVQVPILVAASLVFYSWTMPSLLLLLLLSILINAIASAKVANAPTKNQRLLAAILGVGINLAIIFAFKYGSLITNFVRQIFEVSTPPEGIVKLILHLPLPIGISFYTFEGISLLIDVWREKEKAAMQSSPSSAVNGSNETYFERASKRPVRYLIDTAFFISFFPHLIAGPILKAHSFYPQMGAKYFRDINWRLVTESLILGYFLKMVVADNLKDYTFWIDYPYYQGLGTLTNLVLLFGYSMQIFADFAGYSLIAIGLGAALGYNLMENFDFPYISQSIAEFWRRWHISLSTWLKSYLYIPLGGNRKGETRTYLNLMIVMTLGGLWHGAAWSYAVWGIYHGVGLAVERAVTKPQNSAPTAPVPMWKQFLFDAIKVLGVFVFVSLGWLLFKLPDFSQAVDFLVTLTKNTHIKPQFTYIIPVLVFSLPVLIYHWPHFPTWRAKLPQTNPLERFGGISRLAADLLMGIMLAAILLNSGSANEFIYFQF